MYPRSIIRGEDTAGTIGSRAGGTTRMEGLITANRRDDGRPLSMRQLGRARPQEHRRVPAFRNSANHRQPHTIWITTSQQRICAEDLFDFFAPLNNPLIRSQSIPQQPIGPIYS